MLNFIWSHIYSPKYFRILLIFIFIISEGALDVGPHELPKRTSNVDNRGINFRITNELSDFSGSRYIDREASLFLRQWNLAGMSMSIVKNGKLVYSHGFGYSDVENKQPIEPRELFRIASVSKLITAVAIMKLVQEKKITLDSKVFGPNAILKDPVFDKVKDKRLYSITVRHLLSHSGGWTTVYGDPAFNSLVVLEKTGEEGVPTMDAYCRFIASRRLHFTPGTRYAYSNMGYMFLGKVIEEVSGQPYENFVETQVLRPAGILDMHIGHSYLSQRRLNEVKYYEADEHAEVPAFDGSGRMVPKQYGGNPIELLGAAGGWIASSPELAKLLVQIDGFKSVPDIISSNLIRQMIENKNFRGPLGWKTTYDNGDWVRTGSMAGTSAIIKRQSNGFCWVVVINSSSWKGPRLPAYVSYMMKKIEKKITNWPKTDLFQTTSVKKKS